jgi:predicted aspartyl protease
MTLFATFFLSVFSPAWADTLVLKDGRSIDGIVEREDAESVDLHLGFGTMTFKKDEIAEIKRSGMDEHQKIWDEWNREKEDLKKRLPEEERLRKEREAREDKIREEWAKQAREKEFGPKEIAVHADRGSIYVNVLLNGSVRANLVLDSGASIVMLSKRLAGELGMDLAKMEKGTAKVADGRTVENALGVLESVRVQKYVVKDTSEGQTAGVEAKHVEAAFLLDETPIPIREGDKLAVAEDGLLGMSFLKRFKFNIDYNNKKLTLERLKETESNTL